MFTYLEKWEYRQPGSELWKRAESAVLKAADSILKVDPPASTGRISWATNVRKDENERTNCTKIAVVSCLEDELVTAGLKDETAETVPDTDGKIQAVVDGLVASFAAAYGA